MKALDIRVERAHINPVKDKNKADQLHPHLKNLALIINRNEELSAESKTHLSHYQKMIQEYRITLFPPEMRTKIKVSDKKLKDQFGVIHRFT